MIARHLTNIQNYYKMLQTLSRFLTHTKLISSSIVKIGRLLYQNQIQNSAHPSLCHRWNATELT